MKKMFMLVGLLVVSAFCAKTAVADDVTNCYLTIAYVQIGGTNAVQVTVNYPLSWTSRAFQESSDLSDSNNWRGVMLSEQLIPSYHPSAGVTVYTFLIDGVVGPRYFRMRNLT